MAEPNKTQDYWEDEKVTPYDPAHTPLRIPSRPPDAWPTSYLCINREWWRVIVGMLNRLEYRDAWEGASEEAKQDAVDNVLKLIAMIGRMEDCKPVWTIPDDCDCDPVSITNTINQYTTYKYLNESYYDVITNNYSLNVNLTIEEQIAEMQEAMDAAPTSRQICLASIALVQYLQKLGTFESQNIINETWEDKTTWKLVDDIVGLLAGAGAYIFKSSGLGIASIMARYFDDIVYQTAVLLSKDLTDQEVRDIACDIFEAMNNTTAGYTEFQAITFDVTEMNSLWGDLATPQLYGGWLALLDNPGSGDFSEDCCLKCVEVNPYYEEVFVGLPGSTTGGLQTDSTLNGTTTGYQEIRFRVHMPEPRRVVRIRLNAGGKRYDNTGVGLSYEWAIDTDQHAEMDMVLEDGTAVTNSDLNELNTYYAPAAMVTGTQPDINWFQIKFRWGNCNNCDANELTAFHNSWGIIDLVEYCYLDA